VYQSPGGSHLSYKNSNQEIATAVVGTWQFDSKRKTIGIQLQLNLPVSPTDDRTFCVLVGDLDRLTKRVSMINHPTRILMS
jgi:hypothetical protein